MLTAVLTSLLLLAPAQDEQPPWRPFQSERDVEESPRKKLMRVGGAVGAGAGLAGVLVGTGLSGAALAVVAVTGQLLSVTAQLNQTDDVKNLRNGLLLVVAVGSGVVIVGGVVALCGGLAFIVGAAAFLWSLLMPS